MAVTTLPDTLSGAGPDEYPRIRSRRPDSGSRNWPGLWIVGPHHDFLGALLAWGRRTVTSWISAAQLGEQFRSCYIAVAVAGKKTDIIAAYLVRTVIKPLVAGAERLTLVLDDTPTPRYGLHVQGAGVHHNPTPGPAGSVVRGRSGESSS